MAPDPQDQTGPYARLLAELREIALLRSVSSLLSWDEQTHLPPRGADHRAAQAGLLATLSHARLTSPKLGDLLAAAESGLSTSERTGDSDAAVNLRETRRSYERERKLP